MGVSRTRTSCLCSSSSVSAARADQKVVLLAAMQSLPTVPPHVLGDGICYER